MQQAFETFGVMVDCSRNAVMNLPSLKNWMDLLAKLGYNTLMLYTEDTYEVENQPWFGYLRGRYSREELRELDAYAAGRGMQLVPCIQTLAHLNAIFRWPPYRDLRDCDDILLAGDDRTYALIEDLFSTLEHTFTARVVNIGMDEAHMLGRGKYLDLHGREDGFEILLRHLNRVSEIAKNHGFRLLMWDDMFFRLLSGGQYYVEDSTGLADRVRDLIPDNVELVYWDYYSQDRSHYDRQLQAHAAVKENPWFAGGLWVWSGFAPHNRFSMKANEAALQACKAQGIRHVILTLWGDDGGECARLSALPALYHAAQLAKGIEDPAQICAGFEETFGLPLDQFLLADLPGTPNDCETAIRNPDKYMLYNDLFLGCWDMDIDPADGSAYAACAERLQALTAHPDYGYVFDTLAALCRVLALKWDLGLRTRAAYASGDRAAVGTLVDDYSRLLERTEDFHTVLQRQWMQENKPFGFEVQDLRLGGLMQRIKSCRERLARYAEGGLSSIPELEEPLLSDGTGYGNHNNWAETVSASVI